MHWVFKSSLLVPLWSIKDDIASIRACLSNLALSFFRNQASLHVESSELGLLGEDGRAPHLDQLLALKPRAVTLQTDVCEVGDGAGRKCRADRLTSCLVEPSTIKIQRCKRWVVLNCLDGQT